MSKDKYYRPDLGNVDNFTLPAEDIQDSPLAGMEEGTTIKFKLEEDVIRARISHELYSSFKSAIRELYNNEARSCRETKRQHPETNPEIHITINPVERKITIEGIDSGGISVDIFKNVLSVLGVSSNFSGSEIGQMGMGYASYVMIFEAMVMDTFCRETNEKYSVLADGGVDFKVLGKPDMKHYGTRLSGTYKQEIDIDEFIEVVYKVSRFSQVPTYIHLTDDTQENNAGVQRCVNYKNGYEYIMRMRAEDDNSDRYEVADCKDSDKFFMPIKIERDDFDFYAYLICYPTRYGGWSSYDLPNEYCATTLVGTPIEADMPYKITDSVSGWFLNIKDERKYMPTADRDRMKDDSIDDIVEEIQAEMLKVYERFRLTSVEDYKNKPLKERNMYEAQTWRRISRMFDDTITENIVHTLNQSYTTYPKKYMRSLLQIIEGTDQTERYVTRTLTKDTIVPTKLKVRKVIALKALKSTVIQRLQDHFKGHEMIFFRLPTSDGALEREARIRVLREVGVILGEEYLKLNKVKRLKRSNLTASVVDVPVRIFGTWRSDGWGAGHYGQKHTSHMLSDVNTNAHINLMIIDSAYNWDKIIRHSSDTKFLWVKDRKGYADNVKRLSERFNELENTWFEVNGTQMLFKDIPHNRDKTIVFCRFQCTEDNKTPYTLKELDIESDEYYFIAPANPTKLDDFLGTHECMMGIMSMYCSQNEMTFRREDDGKVKYTLKERLDLTNDTIEGNVLDKVSSLNRLKRLIKGKPHLYHLAREAMIHTNDDNQQDVIKMALTFMGDDNNENV